MNPFNDVVVLGSATFETDGGGPGLTLDWFVCTRITADNDHYGECPM